MREGEITYESSSLIAGSGPDHTHTRTIRYGFLHKHDPAGWAWPLRAPLVDIIHFDAD